MKKIIFSMMCCFVTMVASAQTISWNALINVLEESNLKMKLEKYGIFQNGEEITTVYPSESAGNDQEGIILLLSKSQGAYTLLMQGTMGGWSEYIGSYSGNMLKHEKCKHKGETNYSASNGFWDLRSFSFSGLKFHIVVVDEYNVYRHYAGWLPEVSHFFDLK